MNWTPIRTADDITTIKEESQNGPVLIFKHSTRCAISGMALNRLEKSWNDQDVNGLKPYFLDLITYRSISNLIEHEFDVMHESPQVIVIKNGQTVYNNSHMGINFEDLKNL